MKTGTAFFTSLCFIILANSKLSYAQNQTPTLSPILLNATLPFKINIELAPFQLPVGLQSCSLGVYKNKWLFIGGRLNGLHGFNSSGNFPPNKQNEEVLVFDLATEKAYSKSLYDPEADLSQDEIDTLTVTNSQYYQKNNTLYITGGYGVDTATGNFTTKPMLTAIDIPGLIEWVIQPATNKTAQETIRQIADPTFQVTGGAMRQTGDNPSLLIFGQNFEGEYIPGSNGTYTFQVRRFIINDYGQELSVDILPASAEDPSFRRRDLNVVSRAYTTQDQQLLVDFIALAGVFTAEEDPGIWTVPVEISPEGNPSMADPQAPETFKQGFNIYTSATASLFSARENSTYILILGGITYAYVENEQIETNARFPFTNQVIALKIDSTGNYTQYLLDTQYPVIEPQLSPPGNALLFGTEAMFIPVANVSIVDNNELQPTSTILDLDSIQDSAPEPQVIGYIVGGIQSTMPNTVTTTDTAASPYIFKVVVAPA